MRLASTVRAVALLEAAKGALVLLSGFGALSLIHQDVQRLAEQMVGHLHLNPASRYPRIFVDTAAHLTDARLSLFAILAATYALVRGVEGYGLWRHRRRYLYPLRALRIVQRRRLAFPRCVAGKHFHRWPNDQCPTS